MLYLYGMGEAKNLKNKSLSFETISTAIAVGIALFILLGLIFLMIPETTPDKTLAGITPTAEAAIYGLPKPDALIPKSRAHSYPVLKGIKVNPQDPFKLEFIINTEDQEEVSKEELDKLIKYFLAALTTPEEDLWVNLSPYEQNRVISDNLSLTDLGKDMLGQDYVLKQFLSSLTYPESRLGKKYWDKVYEEVYQLASTTNIPINTFNKVWIVPEKAQVYEHGSLAVIAYADLKAMHEEDYLALKKSTKSRITDQTEKINKVASTVMKEIILPEIERDVNYGENFANLRQMYHSFILATWFKQKLKDSVFQYYIDQKKTEGIDLEDKDAKEKIFNLYVEAYKKGVYNYVKSDYDSNMHQTIDRQYYSGGLQWKADKVSSSAVGANEIKEFVDEPNDLDVVLRVNPLSSEQSKKSDADVNLAVASSGATDFPSRLNLFMERADSLLDHFRERNLLGKMEQADSDAWQILKSMVQKAESYSEDDEASQREIEAYFINNGKTFLKAMLDFSRTDLGEELEPDLRALYASYGAVWGYSTGGVAAKFILYGDKVAELLAVLNNLFAPEIADQESLQQQIEVPQLERKPDGSYIKLISAPLLGNKIYEIHIYKGYQRALLFTRSDASTGDITYLTSYQIALNPDDSLQDLDLKFGEIVNRDTGREDYLVGNSHSFTDPQKLETSDFQNLAELRWEFRGLLGDAASLLSKFQDKLDEVEGFEGSESQEIAGFLGTLANHFNGLNPEESPFDYEDNQEDVNEAKDNDGASSSVAEEASSSSSPSRRRFLKQITAAGLAAIPLGSDGRVLAGEGEATRDGRRKAYLLYDPSHSNPNLSLVHIIKNNMVETILRRGASDLARYNEFMDIIKAHVEQKGVTAIGVEYTPEDWTQLQRDADGTLRLCKLAMVQRGYSEQQAKDLLLLIKGPVFYLYATGYKPLRSGKVKVVGLESKKINDKGLALAREISDLNNSLFANVDINSRPARLYIAAIKGIKEDQILTRGEREKVLESFPPEKREKAERALEALVKFEKNKAERDKAVVAKLRTMQDDILVVRGEDHQKYIDIFSKAVEGDIDFETIGEESSSSSSTLLPKTTGGIDFNPTNLNINVTGKVYFDLPLETIRKFQTSTGMTFQILKIEKGVDLESLISDEENLSYLP